MAGAPITPQATRTPPPLASMWFILTVIPFGALAAPAAPVTKATTAPMVTAASFVMGGMICRRLPHRQYGGHLPPVQAAALPVPDEPTPTPSAIQMIPQRRVTAGALASGRSGGAPS